MSHLRGPAMRTSMSSARRSTGTWPALWYASTMNRAPARWAISARALQVLDGAGGEEDVAGGDGGRAVVDGLGPALEVDGGAVVAGNQDHLDVRADHPLVGDGGEVQGGAHHPVAVPVVEGGGDDGRAAETEAEKATSSSPAPSIPPTRERSSARRPIQVSYQAEAPWVCQSSWNRARCSTERRERAPREQEFRYVARSRMGNSSRQRVQSMART
jgi:hypothetical protein